jgi:hypothetical protein
MRQGVTRRCACTCSSAQACQARAWAALRGGWTSSLPGACQLIIYVLARVNLSSDQAICDVGARAEPEAGGYMFSRWRGHALEACMRRGWRRWRVLYVSRATGNAKVRQNLFTVQLYIHSTLLSTASSLACATCSLLSAASLLFLRRDRSRSSTCTGSEGGMAGAGAGGQKWLALAWAAGKMKGGAASHPTLCCTQRRRGSRQRITAAPQRKARRGPAPRRTAVRNSLLRASAAFFSSLPVLAVARVLRSKRRVPTWRRSSSRASVLGGGQGVGTSLRGASGVECCGCGTEAETQAVAERSFYACG